MAQAPQWAKKAKNGVYRKYIGERSEAPLGSLLSLIFFTFSPKAEHGPRLTEGKIYVAVFCVEVNGDILTECPLEDGRRPFSSENVAFLEVWQIKAVCEIIYDLATIIYDNLLFSVFS